MPFDNGAGQGGGNSSVWFEVRQGPDHAPKGPFTHAVPVSGGARSGMSAVSVRPKAGEYASNMYDSEARVEIHDRSTMAAIGKGDDHRGMFRVRLRIHGETMRQLIAAEPVGSDRRKKLEAYWQALPELAAMLRSHTTNEIPGSTTEDGWDNTAGDVFLVIDVPAIERKPNPPESGPWPRMPWELYWQW